MRRGTGRVIRFGLLLVMGASLAALLDQSGRWLAALPVAGRWVLTASGGQAHQASGGGANPAAMLVAFGVLLGATAVLVAIEIDERDEESRGRRGRR